jgi:hypothetical protein
MRRILFLTIALIFLSASTSYAGFVGMLRSDTAATLQVGPFVDDTDGITLESSLTITQADVRISKNGANIAQKNDTTACTYDEVGYYSCPINATDTNTEGRLQVIVNESGALLVSQSYQVVNANVFDSLYAVTITDYLQTDTISVSSAALDDIWGEALTELGAGAPSATPAVRDAIMLLYMYLRNKTETTASETRITNNAGTVITESNLSDNGTTFTKGEYGAVD